MYVKKIFQIAVSAVNKIKKGDTVDSEWEEKQFWVVRPQWQPKI